MCFTVFAADTEAGEEEIFADGAVPLIRRGREAGCGWLTLTRHGQDNDATQPDYDATQELSCHM